MKMRKGLITLAIVGLMSLLLCLAGTVFGRFNPPDKPVDTKLRKSKLDVTAIATWRPDGTADPITGVPNGITEVFFVVEDKLYIVEADEWNACDFYLNSDTPEGVFGNVELFLPGDQIAADFGRPPGSEAVIWEQKDLSNQQFTDNCDSASNCPAGVDCFQCKDLAGNVLADITTCDDIGDINYVTSALGRLSFIEPTGK